jgi:hypothetical protein
LNWKTLVAQKCHSVSHLLNYPIRSGSQQLTSGFGSANIEIASTQLDRERWKHHNKVYLRIIDTLHYVNHSKKDSATGFNIMKSLERP